MSVVTVNTNGTRPRVFSVFDIEAQADMEAFGGPGFDSFSSSRLSFLLTSAGLECPTIAIRLYFVSKHV